jgi:hypothetical protein
VNNTSAKVSKKLLISNDYGNWLSGTEWTHFMTGTTRNEMTMNSARRQAEGYHKWLSMGGDTTMFFAAEPFDVREGYHIHALVKLPELLDYKDAVLMWQKVTGAKKKSEWNRIELKAYDNRKGASYYCGKYITKNLSDYDYFAPIRLGEKQKKDLSASWQMFKNDFK